MKHSLKKIDVENVFAGGRIFKTPAFLLRFTIPQEPSARIAFVFSKHCGSSVERHTYKRRFRELLRVNAGAHPVHLVVQPRKKLSVITRQDWLNEKVAFENFLSKHVVKSQVALS